MMYTVIEEQKKDLKNKNTNKVIADAIGITQEYLSEIFNGRKCSKLIAYCLTKYRDKNAEIEDYFERTE